MCCSDPWLSRLRANGFTTTTLACGLDAQLRPEYMHRPGLLWLPGQVVCSFKLVASYWLGLLWLTGLVNCSLLVRLINLAYLPGSLLLPDQAYCCKLIAAYWPGLLWLTGLIICSLLVRYAAYLLDRLTATCLSALLWLPAPLICGLLIRLTDQAY